MGGDIAVRDFLHHPLLTSAQLTVHSFLGLPLLPLTNLHSTTYPEGVSFQRAHHGQEQGLLQEGKEGADERLQPGQTAKLCGGIPGGEGADDPHVYSCWRPSRSPGAHRVGGQEKQERRVWSLHKQESGLASCPLAAVAGFSPRKRSQSGPLEA